MTKYDGWTYVDSVAEVPADRYVYVAYRRSDGPKVYHGFRDVNPDSVYRVERDPGVMKNDHVARGFVLDVYAWRPVEVPTPPPERVK